MHHFYTKNANFFDNHPYGELQEIQLLLQSIIFNQYDLFRFNIIMPDDHHIGSEKLY